MLTTDSVQTRYIGESTAQGIAHQWNSVYPTMRRILDTVIAAQRRAERPTVDIPKLEQVRRELGQLDRGTFQSCTRSSGGFSASDAIRNVHEVLNVTSIGHPEKGDIYRLAGALADQQAARTAAWRTEQETGVPVQAVDRGRRDRADSEQHGRGTTR